MKAAYNPHGAALLDCFRDTSWLPDDDVQAVISFVRSVPPVDRTVGETRFGLLGKILDRLDACRWMWLDASTRTLPPRPFGQR